MNLPLLALLIVAQTRPEEIATGSLESVRAEYRADAKKYAFFAASNDKQPLTLVPDPIFSWTSLKDYSGDVFVWTNEGLPVVVGCMLSSPNGPSRRNMIHEFHLAADTPLAPLDLPSKQWWQPAEGLKRTLIADAPVPAASAPARLAQLRQLSRNFAVHMEAVNGNWELRLLPQPIFRYGTGTGEVIDGALLAYVWTTGTDPEFLLLLECRQTPDGSRWHFAPLKFTLRPLRLELQGREVWRVEAHKEPPGQSNQFYTSGFVRTIGVNAPGAPSAAK